MKAHLNKVATQFTFTFTPGVTVSDFKLHMPDYGDWNPTLATNHLVTMKAFNASNVLVAQQTLSYTTPASDLPASSSLYGDLKVNGDAVTAAAGMPGNWTWHVSGTGITRVVLTVGVGPDPNFGLDLLYFTTGCP